MALDKEQTIEDEAVEKEESEAELDAAFLDPPFPYRVMPAPDWVVVDKVEDD
jgi:16S rRNA G966 N2-methylase RsmD